MTPGPRSVLETRALGLVAVGGAVGAGARWAIVEWTSGPGAFPWWTLLVNVAGCLLLGLLVRAERTLLLAGGVGFCGGLTTFSTFSVEIATLLDRGDGPTAATYLIASLVLGALAYLAGREVAPR